MLRAKLKGREEAIVERRKKKIPRADAVLMHEAEVEHCLRIAVVARVAIGSRGAVEIDSHRAGAAVVVAVADLDARLDAARRNTTSVVESELWASFRQA